MPGSRLYDLSHLRDDRDDLINLCRSEKPIKC